MPFGVTQNMIDAYGEAIYQLSLNRQRRRGDPVRLLDYDAVEAQRADMGLTDTEIASRVGLSVDQVRFVRVYLERQHYRIDQHRKLFHLGGGRRWREDKYEDPADRINYPEAGMRVRTALTFNSAEVARFLAEDLWGKATLDTWVNQATVSRPNAPMLIAGEHSMSYAEVQAQVGAIASGLKSLGLGRGDVIAMQLPNTVEFVVGHLAVARIGAVLQTIHMPYRAGDIGALLEHSQARAVIALDVFRGYDLASIMLAERHRLSSLEEVIVVGQTPREARSFWSLSESGVPLDQHDSAVAADPCLLLYTSGTTSSPKGVPLTYQNMLGNIEAAADEFEVTEHDRILSAAPFSHLYGIFNFHMALSRGAAAVLLPAFTPQDLGQAVSIHQPTMLFLGPAHAAAMLGQGLINQRDFASVRFSVFSGASCPTHVLESYQAAIPASTVAQLWGMTEIQAGSFTRASDPLSVAATSAGPPARGNQARIRSLAGDILLAGEEGELEIRGPSVFGGYLDNHEANAAAFTTDGWFRSGDLACIDDSGYIRLTGRTKDLINRGGVKYNPTDLEVLLMQNDAIDQAAIVAMPDPILGEKACCFVTLQPGFDLSLTEVCVWLEGKNISKVKWPERLEIVEEMPLTPTRKIIKGELAQRLNLS